MRRPALKVLAVAFAVFTPMGAARADQGPGEATPGGYSVSVRVQFSGSAAPGGGAGVTKDVNLHPLCWWEPAPGNYTNAAAMLDWYDGVTGGVQSIGMIAQYGDRAVWEDAVAREEAGQDLSWYRAYCTDPRNYIKYGLGSRDTGDDNPVAGNNEGWATFLYRAFGAGEAIPAPMIDPAELADAARDNLEIPAPDIDRNPRVHDTEDATLVGLPTFFWVTDPASVGGDTGGELSIRAEVAGAADPVWAEVTATIKPAGLVLNWPGGSKNCEPAVAIREYTKGMADAGACTVEFQRASTGYPGGYPVQASTGWGAVWEGPDGAGGELADLATEVVELIPVAEVQNVVDP